MDRHLADFLGKTPDAAMITLRADGSAHMARIEVAVVNGRLWASGSAALVRTHNLRRDPRCSLFVFGAHPDWVGVEAVVTILEGPETPRQLVDFMRARHGEAAGPGMVFGHDDELGHDRPFTEAEFMDHVRAERRLIYQFEINRVYGNYPQ
ncbi:pyridoxamine 5'-phosphate oxidase family protein [Nocardia sp. NPDC020380]|uniref:pyridoxamine 5'-phosphate oxidase family protein n=1 Tax=Nocardia sp. NPDC020380 TaxID=3364309 RepID=UPI0037984132